MEYVNIFDDQFHKIGMMTRKQAHETGAWHETFHCWFVDETSVYLQKRSANKKDFPSYFDITVAGHLEAHETVKDGIREIKEEVGMDVNYESLTKVAIIQDVICQKAFYDYEFAHVYVYQSIFKANDFKVDGEEVEGIYRVEKQQFIHFARQQIKSIVAEKVDDLRNESIGYDHFVPHETHYFQQLANFLDKQT